MMILHPHRSLHTLFFSSSIFMGSKHLLKCSPCAVTISSSSSFLYHHLLHTHHRPQLFFSPLLSKPISKILPFASTSSRLCSTALSRAPTTVQVEDRTAEIDGARLAALKQKLEQLGISCATARPAENSRLMCPECEGGSTMERSLALLITADCNAAVWTCHRGKCGWKGKIRAVEGVSASFGTANRIAKATPCRKITEQSIGLEPLCEELLEYFMERMITRETLRRNAVMQKSGDEVLIAFTYKRNGVLVSCKYRSIDKVFRQHVVQELDIAQVEKQAVQLEENLIVKERETLEVLKQLESTKKVVEELKLKLQKEASESVAVPVLHPDDTKICHVVEQKENQNLGNIVEIHQDLMGGLSPFPSSSPGLILMELKQAKVNLNRTTSDLAGIRASVDSLNRKIEKERISLKKTHERLTSNSARISSLEEELNQTRVRLQLAKDCGNPTDISRELQKLSSEAEEFKKMAESAKSEVLRTMSEIERTKSSIRTAEIRWIAAKKMAEAARATEAVALAEIKVLSTSENASGIFAQHSDGVTLSFEEYSSLIRKAQEAEELSKKKVLDAMLHIEEANVSKMEILKKVEEAAKEIKTSKKVLVEAQSRVEAANRGKLAVEESLRRWRSEHGQRRRSVSSSTKFKNSYSCQHRRDSRHFDLNELNRVNDVSKPVLKQTLSIGQILSRKLLIPEEEFELGMQSDYLIEKPKVSLAQMLGKQSVVLSPPRESELEEGSAQKPVSAKRKKSGFARFSLLLAKQSKKKKKQASRWNTCRGEL